MGITTETTIVETLTPAGYRYNAVPVRYDWDGVEATVHWRDYPNAHIGDCIEIGPYVGRIVDYDYAGGNFVVVRCDTLGDVWAALYPVKAFLQIIYWRLLWTLNIWGLADTPEGSIMSWRDVHFGKRN
jgi:hypothetical protein